RMPGGGVCVACRRADHSEGAGGGVGGDGAKWVRGKSSRASGVRFLKGRLWVFCDPPPCALPCVPCVPGEGREGRHVTFSNRSMASVHFWRRGSTRGGRWGW